MKVAENLIDWLAIGRLMIRDHNQSMLFWVSGLLLSQWLVRACVYIDTVKVEFTMIVTAGMQNRQVCNAEKYSVMRAMRAIDRSSVILMVLNAEKEEFVSTTSRSLALPMKRSWKRYCYCCQ